MFVLGRPAGVLDSERLQDAANGRSRRRQLQVGSEACQHRAYVHACNKCAGLCVSCEQLRPTTVARQQMGCSYEAADLNLFLR